jgi:uncharacterized protein
MENKPRIKSILESSILDSSITGFKSFSLDKLILNNDLNFELPTNLRLGHLAEKVVSQAIKASSNYDIINENVQLIDKGKTIGEIDFIISEKETKQIIHLELAYKFYLFDPNYSEKELNNWIGPNRKDAFSQKIEKIRTKQFPLLHHKITQEKFKNIDIKSVSQNLCLMISMYIPFEFIVNFNLPIKAAIKGYYLNIEKFIQLDHSEINYYLPSKKEWGIDPSQNKEWMNFKEIEEELKISISEKQSRLCWGEQKGNYFQFFIIWW